MNRDCKSPIIFQKKNPKDIPGQDCRDGHYEHYVDLCLSLYHLKHIYTVTIYEDTENLSHD
jgi:hypothetical protein